MQDSSDKKVLEDFFSGELYKANFISGSKPYIEIVNIDQEKEKVVFKRHTETAILPLCMTVDSSCLDIFSDEGIYLESGKVTRVKTNVSVNLPKGYELQIRPRSSLSLKGIIAIFGTVDADYRLPLDVMLLNISGLPFEVKQGDRIAQVKVAAPSQVNFVDEEGKVLVKNEKTREGGFGSTN